MKWNVEIMTSGGLTLFFPSMLFCILWDCFRPSGRSVNNFIVKLLHSFYILLRLQLFNYLPQCTCIQSIRISILRISIPLTKWLFISLYIRSPPSISFPRQLQHENLSSEKMEKFIDSIFSLVTSVTTLWFLAHDFIEFYVI